MRNALARLFVALLVVGLVGSATAAAATHTTDADGSSEVTVRIAARRLADGRIEFALQQRQADGNWGERLLPARRFFPAGAAPGEWLVSSPVTVS